MRRILFSTLLLSVCMARAGALNAQEVFDLTSPVASAAVPDLNTSGLIEGTKGQEVEFTADITITSKGLTGEEGPQGWSLSVRNDGVEVTATTVEGTVSASTAKGGLVDGGFVVTELIDPAKKGNNGKKGMVQAVVLSFTLPVSLPPNTSQVSAKNTYRATIGDAEVAAVLKFEDGLIGKGQPVQNNITFKGQTKIPTLGEKKITVRQKSVPVENTVALCSDGLDNDSDGKTDCDDTECVGLAPCLETGNCTDGKDNDKDGKTDCADTDCAGEATCKEVGNCKDGKDNDVDGKTDCDDDDCAGKDPGCPAGGGTKGFDLILSTVDSARVEKHNVATIDCNAATPSLEAIVSIERTKDPEVNGAQGWSIAITHDSEKLLLEGPTIDGTDAAALFDGGFKKTEAIDPAKNAGKSGWVSAVVLSFTQPIVLDPAKNQTIGKAKYSVKAGEDEDLPTTISFQDGLRGSGQPVQNIITVNGSSVTPTNLINLEVKCGIGPPPSGKFVRGNANDDGKVNIADPIWIINELVRQGPKTKCQDAADANDDGLVDLSDAMYLITWRFLAGPPPKAPFPACGADVGADTLNCPEGSATTCP